ncbi:ATP-binding cassette domain-containing protein [Acidaminobacter sp. JC074]|uniref:phosphonate ABC transporter ATP-binding protein n=1 Tax=Acidaminobacter sp. JC074 TaxID=2530199 RepID=UPI001F1029BF|nr:ATP-binding cassette domain-containing protein [Acidaminobacter sp. JC074]MCH4888691.1 ATP-binding cassette domain-containing protein [Acidaminobacter sp. JC074]
MIKVRNLNCVKDNQTILKDINLTIEKNEKVAIIGPSGAGKTTLFNILSKLDESYSGQIIINGHAIESYKDNKSFASQIGVISQGIHLIDNLKVIHNVLSGKLKDWSFIQSMISLVKPFEKEVALEALQKVSMAEHVNKKTAHLSGGEKQRVAIAKLIVQNPNIILADEPIAALDPKLAKEAIQLLIHHLDSKTIIAILHQVDYAKEYFDRIIGIKDGCLVFDIQSTQLTEKMIGDLYA